MKILIFILGILFLGVGLLFTFQSKLLFKPAEAKARILYFHGTADSVIPYVQAKLLSQENKNIQFISVNGGDHNNLSEFPQYWDGVKKFIDSIHIGAQ